MLFNLNKKIQSQNGAALLAFILLLLVSSTYLLIKQLNGQDYNSIRTNDTLKVLAEAKQALIAYAVTYYENNPGEFGFLPCPDSNAGIGLEGDQDPNCAVTNANSLGKLPWGTLGLPPLFDGSGECLWYAVSGDYKSNPPSAMLNDDSRGAFIIRRNDALFSIQQGNNPNERVVAVVFAPGEAINNQSRVPLPLGVEQCSGNYDATQYLDAFNIYNNANVNAAADSIDTFLNFGDITGGADNNNDGIIDGNDVLITITAQEIFDAVKKRSDFALKLYDNSNPNNLTLKIAECISGYGVTNSVNNQDPDSNSIRNQSLPWPASIAMTDYRLNNDITTNFDDLSAPAVLSGRLPTDITNSNNAIYSGCAAPQICAPPSNNLMTYCDNFWQGTLGLTAVQSAELISLWSHWKDHLFYAVSQAYQPQSIAIETSFCNDGTFCITTMPLGQPPGLEEDWAAIVFFSNEVLNNPDGGGGAQSRDSIPLDVIDQKNNINNYLEGVNRTVYNNGAGNVYYDNTPAVNDMNDILYCIQDDDSLDGIIGFQAGLCP